MPTDDGGTTPSSPDLEQLMMRYQNADPNASAVLVELLSPKLYRFFASQLGSRADAEDMLQDVWLRIHRVRHTYRPGEPLLPWVFAIARCVRVDNYRKRHRISLREMGVDVLPEPPQRKDGVINLRSGSSKLPPEAAEHVAGCECCRRLVRVLERHPEASAPSESRLQQIQAAMLRDLKPVRPLAPSRVYLSAFALIFLVV